MLKKIPSFPHSGKESLAYLGFVFGFVFS